MDHDLIRQAIRLLIAFSGDPNTKNSDGDTPLHVACGVSPLLYIQMLLECELSVDVQNEHTLWPMDVFFRRILKRDYTIDLATLDLVKKLCPIHSSVWLSPEKPSGDQILLDRLDRWSKKFADAAKWDVFGVLEKLKIDIGAVCLYFPPTHPSSLTEDGRPPTKPLIRAATLAYLVREIALVYSSSSFLS